MPTPNQLFIFSLLLAALALILWAASLIWRLVRSAQMGSRMHTAVNRLQTMQSAQQAATAAADSSSAFAPPSTQPARDGFLLNPLSLGLPQKGGEAAAQAITPPAWLNASWAKTLLADEDRKLLDQAGISLRTGSIYYIIWRAALAIVLPLLVLLFMHTSGVKTLIALFFGFGLGLMAPKWYIRLKAARRRKQVVEELPLFVDLLRLLQGVGLSIDQSLQILATEFGSVLRVLSKELRLANQLYASGRSREQSFQRLANLSADDDMTAVVSLLVQVDRHGGAVQEPLNQFGTRLREKRQAAFKERIGQITVKMTAVMVLTLLPALMVITAGPGFMAVIQSMANLGGR